MNCFQVAKTILYTRPIEKKSISSKLLAVKVPMNELNVNMMCLVNANATSGSQSINQNSKQTYLIEKKL